MKYSPDLLTLAQLCEQSYEQYGGTPPSGWRVALIDANRASITEPQIYCQFVAYFNPIENQLVITFRGTDFSDPNDLLNDIDIFFSGRPEQRTNDALTFVRRAIALTHSWSFWYQQGLFAQCHWHNPKIHLTGHSLGAAVAEAVCLQTGYPTTTFDSPGVLPTNLNNTIHNNQIRSILNYPNLVNCCNPHCGHIYHLDAEAEVSIKKQTTRKFFKIGAAQAAAMIAPKLAIPAYIKIPTKQLVPQFDPIDDTLRKHSILHFIKALQSGKQPQLVYNWPTLQNYLQALDPNRLVVHEQNYQTAKQ